MKEQDRTFLEKHRDADSIVCDTKTGLPVRAEYYAPSWALYQENRRFFAQAVAAREEEGE